MDPAAYIVSDGKNLYYAVQVYIDYPLQSGFSASPYLRFFGVVLVNIQDGSMQGYNVSNLMAGPTAATSSRNTTATTTASWGARPRGSSRSSGIPNSSSGRPDVPGQLDYDFTYHVSDPFIFRSGTQFYERPNVNTTVQYIPFAVRNKTYFVGMQLVQYQGAVSKNLAVCTSHTGGTGWARSPCTRTRPRRHTIIGPSAAENALNTNSQVRTQLTLLPELQVRLLPPLFGRGARLPISSPSTRTLGRPGWSRSSPS